jgi:hypothetical protein
LEPITRKKAFIASKTLHNFLLQFKTSTPELLGAISKIKGEITQDLNFKTKQITMGSYFNKI